MGPSNVSSRHAGQNRIEKAQSLFQEVWEALGNARLNAQQALFGLRPSPLVRRAAGKRVIITGGTSGVGEATAEALASAGATVVITSRSMDNAKAAAERIMGLVSSKGETGAGQVKAMQLDLTSLQSVKQFCRELEKGPLIDVLLCNAGIMCPLQRQETCDGCEVQFQVNHLGHMILSSRLAAQRLLQSTKQAKQPVPPLRIVMVSSVTHQRGRIHYDDLQAEVGYVPFERYAQSKLANIMTAFEISARSAAVQAKHGLKDKSVTCAAVHPGVVNTPLARHFFENDYGSPLLRRMYMPFLGFLYPMLLITPRRSVQSVLHGALGDAAEVDGQYVTVAGVQRSNATCHDPTERGRLWDISCQVVGMDDPLDVRKL